MLSLFTFDSVESLECTSKLLLESYHIQKYITSANLGCSIFWSSL